MKAYASESYYIGVYLCGREPDISAAFDFYAMQATSLMKQYTLDNVDENDIPEEVKMCCCELAENIFKAEQEGALMGYLPKALVAGQSHMKAQISAGRTLTEPFTISCTNGSAEQGCFTEG